jgi:hypothetical protein
MAACVRPCQCPGRRADKNIQVYELVRARTSSKKGLCRFTDAHRKLFSICLTNVVFHIERFSLLLLLFPPPDDNPIILPILYPSISSADLRVNIRRVLLKIVTVEDSERSGMALEKCS